MVNTPGTDLFINVTLSTEAVASVHHQGVKG